MQSALSRIKFGTPLCLSRYLNMGLQFENLQSLYSDVAVNELCCVLFALLLCFFFVSFLQTPFLHFCHFFKHISKVS
jgi:hypothetical protein